MCSLAVLGMFALFFLIPSLSSPAQSKEMRCGLMMDFTERIIDLELRKCAGQASGHHVKLRNHLGAGYIEFEAGPDVVSQETTCEGEGCAGTTYDQAGCWAILEDGDCWVTHTFTDRTRIGRLSIYVSSSNTEVESFGLRFQASDLEPPRLVAMHELTEAVSRTAAFDFVMEFSEAIEMTQGVESIRVANASVEKLHIVSPRRLRAEILPDGKGNVLIQVPAGAMTDGSGNPVVESDTYIVAYDSLPPSVAFSEGPWTHDGHNAVRVRLSFSEPVTGIDPDSLDVSNGLLTGFHIIDRQNVEIELVPVDDRDLLVAVPAGEVHDRAGNLNATSPTMRIAGLGPQFARKVIADFNKAFAMQHVDLESRLLPLSEIVTTKTDYSHDPSLRIEKAFAAPNPVVAFLFGTPAVAHVRAQPVRLEDRFIEKETIVAAKWQSRIQSSAASATFASVEPSLPVEPIATLAHRFGDDPAQANRAHEKRLSDAFMVTDNSFSTLFPLLLVKAGAAGHRFK